MSNVKSKQDIAELVAAWSFKGNTPASDLVDLATFFFNEGLVLAANTAEREGPLSASRIDELQVGNK